MTGSRPSESKHNQNRGVTFVEEFQRETLSWQQTARLDSRWRPSDLDALRNLRPRHKLVLARVIASHNTAMQPSAYADWLCDLAETSSQRHRVSTCPAPSASTAENLYHGLVFALRGAGTGPTSRKEVRRLFHKLFVRAMRGSATRASPTVLVLQLGEALKETNKDQPREKKLPSSILAVLAYGLAYKLGTIKEKPDLGDPERLAKNYQQRLATVDWSTNFWYPGLDA
ncbi:MAG: hypothetical protein HS111_14505 [Kofleriaceae bacterium]|nr:hypothetical protein [Kofleriaceae bacterium]